MNDSEVRAQVAALEDLLDRLPPAAAEAIEALLRLYGETLRRIVAAAADSPQLADVFAGDELISHMLAAHDLDMPRKAAAPQTHERCDLCSEPLSEVHQHLLDTAEKTVLCACAVCALLFPQRADAGGRYRFIPEAATRLEEFDFDELTWRAFEIPVQIAYFVRSSKAGRVVAYYPSPVGAVESLLPLDAWEELEERNPALRELVADTQALLVNGTGPEVEGWIVGIDTCFRLVAIMRSHWRGTARRRSRARRIATLLRRAPLHINVSSARRKTCY